jgi:hypothetical protein
MNLLATGAALTGAEMYILLIFIYSGLLEPSHLEDQFEGLAFHLSLVGREVFHDLLAWRSVNQGHATHHRMTHILDLLGHTLYHTAHPPQDALFQELAPVTV